MMHRGRQGSDIANDWDGRTDGKRTKVEHKWAFLLYGWETWLLNNTLAARLDSLDSRALRRIEGIKWHQHNPNKAQRERTNQLLASCLTSMSRVRWYGHAFHLPNIQYVPFWTLTLMEMVGKVPEAHPLAEHINPGPQSLQYNSDARPASFPRWRKLVIMVGSSFSVQDD